MIKRAIEGKTDPAAKACTGIAYERRNGRVDVDGVQKACEADKIGARTNAVKHAGSRLEAKIADSDRHAVIGDRADRGDQRAGIRIDLNEGAGAASRYG